MSTLKCPQCGMVNWATQAACKRCGLGFQDGETHYDGYAPAHDYPAATSAAGHGRYQPPDSVKSGLAISSMVLGILAFVTGMFLIGLLFAPIGFVLGIVALVKANRRPNIYGGKGFAIAGIIVSSLAFMYAPIILAIAIPNLLAARRAANEGSAIATIRKLSEAEIRYMTSMGKCGDIQTLIAGGLADPVLSQNSKNGYRFVIAGAPDGACEINATPLVADGISATGLRSFYASSGDDWTIRFGLKEGRPATRTDKVLGDADYLPFGARSGSR